MCPTSWQAVNFSLPLSDADAVRKAVLSGCATAPGRNVRLQASAATIVSTTWGEYRPTLGDTAMNYPNDEPLAIVTLTGIEGYDDYMVVLLRSTGDLVVTRLRPPLPPSLSGATPTPTPRPTIALGGENEPPTGPGVEIGRPYLFSLYVHCGVRDAKFDGRWWMANPMLGDNNPPAGWTRDDVIGEMELVEEDLAVFTAKSGTIIEFIPWPSDVKHPPCL
jgi:hypothetical protein